MTTFWIIVLAIGSVAGGILLIKQSATKFELTDEQQRNVNKRKAEQDKKDKEDNVLTEIFSKMTVETMGEAQHVFNQMTDEEAKEIYTSHVESAKNIHNLYGGAGE